MVLTAADVEQIGREHDPVSASEIVADRIAEDRLARGLSAEMTFKETLGEYRSLGLLTPAMEAAWADPTRHFWVLRLGLKVCQKCDRIAQPGIAGTACDGTKLDDRLAANPEATVFEIEADPCS